MKPIIYWLCLVAMVALVLFGCNTTKDVVKTVTNTVIDSTAIKQRDSLKLAIKEQRVKHEEEIKTIKSTGIVFSDCDTVIIDERCNVDSILTVLAKVRNKVKILSDGSIEAEGRIQSAYSNSESLRQYNFELEQKVTELSQVKDSLAVALNKEIASKVVDKDVKRGFPVFWSLLFFVAGFFLRHYIVKKAR